MEESSTATAVPEGGFVRTNAPAVRRAVEKADVRDIDPRQYGACGQPRGCRQREIHERSSLCERNRLSMQPCEKPGGRRRRGPAAVLLQRRARARFITRDRIGYGGQCDQREDGGRGGHRAPIACVCFGWGAALLYA